MTVDRFATVNGTPSRVAVAWTRASCAVIPNV
jgi:hypothetical protein